MEYLNRLINIAQQIADERPQFFDIKGAGAGDKDTHMFMAELHKRANNKFGDDFAKKFAEQRICGDNNNFKVDFYFPEEKTIVEVALTLRNSSREFEKDIIKAILVKRAGNDVDKLVFVSKDGAIKRNEEPGPRSIISWVEQDYGIKVITMEIQKAAK